MVQTTLSFRLMQNGRRWKFAETGNKENLKHSLLIHQQGQTDYLTFCRQSAEAGVEKWIVDMENMTCTYYDKPGNKMLVEDIPIV